MKNDTVETTVSDPTVTEVHLDSVAMHLRRQLDFERNEGMLLAVKLRELMIVNRRLAERVHELEQQIVSTQGAET